MDEVRAKLINLLSGQNILESKLLLDEIGKLDDLTEIVSDQWVPCTTDVNNQNASRILALIKSEELLGLGPVLLVQVNNLLTF